MRNLRQRLMDIAKTQSEPKPQPLNREEPLNTFFCREDIVPLNELGDIRSVTLEDVRACDPYFEGNSWKMDRLLFLDTETTGLNGGAGTVAFEIGVGWFDARGMVIRQYVMCNYAQEAAMLKDIARLFEKAGDRRIIIATFASNIYRIQQILDLAVKHGRKVSVSGRSMVGNIQMAFDLGYLKAPENVMIDPEKVKDYEPGQMVIITTGSQGEPLSALSRMASGTHRQFSVSARDFIIISATPIPGNEKMVTRVVNGLLKLGAEVIYESMYDVHVSGHAYQEELKLMLKLVNPMYFMPVHGEYKHLKKHSMLAQSIGIKEENIVIGNVGEPVSFSKDGMTKCEPVTAGSVMVDGLGVGDVGSVVLRDRRHLSQDGLVVVVFTVDNSTGELLSGPDIVSRGFVYVKESEELISEARLAARSVIEKYQDHYYKDWTVIKAKIRDQVSQVLYRRTKRSPMVLPIVMEV